VIFALCWPLLLSLGFFVTEILTLVSMEFVALQVCAELVVQMFCSIGQSTAPAIVPHAP
jgi:hypothetical protein